MASAASFMELAACPLSACDALRVGDESVSNERDSVAVGDALADKLVALDPLLASEWGLRSRGLPAFDPEWWEARKCLFSEAVSALASGPAGLTSEVLLERA